MRSPRSKVLNKPKQRSISRCINMLSPISTCFSNYFFQVFKNNDSCLRHDFLNSILKNMSQAFVRESEEQWLHEVSPTLPALIVYLTRENNGVRVYEKK